ncbi:AcrR family transcriptional regulator [Rhodopseudomonas julia]|uniref:AcrR family transcriptional regulator n=1 Tax=Rhodopseudomonas julia TaxID=200617 RepID=A0ABU0C3F8_9BRAD|nr:TetR family transcriptional regulator [Rhodopseudomonas julia]MDQ0324471.1 AcrR family transcriptional regulator [Rhodopseudomonas julia]
MRRTKADALQTREAILRAAMEVFFQEGVARATLAQVAAEAGVTRGAIYWHFKNKAEILEAIRDRLRLLEDDIVEAAMAQTDGDILNRLHGVTIDSLARLENCEETRKAYSIIMCKSESTGEIGCMIEKFYKAGNALRDCAGVAFEDASQGGLLHPSWRPDIAARAYNTMFFGLIHQWLRFGQPFDIGEVGREVFAALFSSFRCPKASGAAAQAAREPAFVSERAASSGCR